MNMGVAGFFLLGLSFGLGPCLSGCGPMLISYIVGTEKNIAKSLFSYLLFSLAKISTYLIIGLLFFSLGKLIAGKMVVNISKYVIISGGVFVILTGILIALGRKMELGLCRFLFKGPGRDKRNIIVLGLIIGVLPCAPLLAIFSSAGLNSNSFSLFFLYIFSFGLGSLFSPLAVLVLVAGFIPKLLVSTSAIKKSIYSRILNSICGLIMVILGVNLIVKGLS